MLNLLEKNHEMIQTAQYKLPDERKMAKIDALDAPNDYDLYLIACTLCNYPELSEEEHEDAIKLRMDYWHKTNGGSKIGFVHAPEEFKKVKSRVSCKNTGNINKYGLYEYELNANTNSFTSELWDQKSKNRLKYVDNKTYPDKTIVSISKDQYQDFIKMLDEFMISYDKDDLESNLFYKNKSENHLLDWKNLTFMPFTPYDFQLEDAEEIIKKKRFLIGHDMGCGKTFISILVGSSIGETKNVSFTTSDKLNYEDIVITDKGPLPIGKIVEENIDCKVQVVKNGEIKYVNILDRKKFEDEV